MPGRDPGNWPIGDERGGETRILGLKVAQTMFEVTVNEFTITHDLANKMASGADASLL